MNSAYPRWAPFYARWQRWLAPWPLLAITCLLLGLGGDVARDVLRYERTALLDGELWRLVTGHLVHLGWPHLLFNVAALAILGSLFAAVLTPRQWWLGLLVSVLVIDAGLFVGTPPVAWYVGLSGVLHGVVTLGALRLLSRPGFVGRALLAGVLIKVAWEQWRGPLPFAEAATGPVLVDAHLYGIAGGLVCFGMLWAFRRRPAAPL